MSVLRAIDDKVDTLFCGRTADIVTKGRLHETTDSAWWPLGGGSDIADDEDLVEEVRTEEEEVERDVVVEEMRRAETSGCRAFLYCRRAGFAGVECWCSETVDADDGRVVYFETSAHPDEVIRGGTVDFLGDRLPGGVAFLTGDKAAYPCRMARLLSLRVKTVVLSVSDASDGVGTLTAFMGAASADTSSSCISSTCSTDDGELSGESTIIVRFG